MKNIFTFGIKSIIFFIIFLLQIACFGQETSFLNRFRFPVKDTVAHKPYFYQDRFSYPDSTIVRIYTIDSSLVKEEVHLLDKEHREIYSTILEYDSLGNIEARREKDRKANSEYSVGFYPDGQLRSRLHYIKNIPLLEEYFDANGNPAKKPDEEHPSPKGGIKGWNQYLANNMVYPKAARKKRQEGLVYVWFKVDAEGNLQDPEIMNPEQVYPLLAEEALRVIKKYPHQWSPGMKDGIAVPVMMRMPINFRFD